MPSTRPRQPTEQLKARPQACPCLHEEWEPRPRCRREAARPRFFANGGFHLHLQRGKSRVAQASEAPRARGRLRKCGAVLSSRKIVVLWPTSGWSSTVRQFLSYALAMGSSSLNRNAFMILQCHCGTKNSPAKRNAGRRASFRSFHAIGARTITARDTKGCLAMAFTPC